MLWLRPTYPNKGPIYIHPGLLIAITVNRAMLTSAHCACKTTALFPQFLQWEWTHLIPGIFAFNSRANMALGDVNGAFWTDVHLKWSYFGLVWYIFIEHFRAIVSLWDAMSMWTAQSLGPSNPSNIIERTCIAIYICIHYQVIIYIELFRSNCGWFSCS